MDQASQTPKVVIVGGGFAGLSCYLLLEKSNRKVDLTLIDKEKDFEYAPSYHEALVDAEKDRSIRLSLRKFAGKNFINNEVTQVTDTEVITDSGKHIPYDYLVIATGSSTNYFGNESFKKHGLPVKRLEDVKVARQAIKSAETVTVVGGGYTGIEIATMLAAKTKKKINLVHSRDRVLHVLDEKSSKQAENFLRKHKVELFLKARAAKFTPKSVELNDGRKIDTDVIIFSSGVSPNTQMLEKEIEIDSCLFIKDKPRIYMCGDTCPQTALPTAHNAMIEGRFVAKKIINEIDGFPDSKPQDRDWRILAVALGPTHGILTFGSKGYPLPFITGFGKWLVERRVMFEFEKKILLPI